MLTEDVLILAKAGFTAQQIAALSALTSKPASAPAPAPEPAPAPAPEPAPAPAPTNNEVAELLAKMGALTDAVQANGLAGANQPPKQTTDDILAAIIAPPIKKE